MSQHHHSALPKITPGALAPLVAMSPHHAPESVIMVGYGPTGYEERTEAELPVILSVIKELRAKWPVVWVDVDGLGNTKLIHEIGDMLGLDRLVLEDIFDTHQVPKAEEFEHYLLAILKNGLFKDQKHFQSEQIALVLTQGLVVTFQECPGDSFEQLRKRIRGAIGRVRQFGADYLLYAVIDAVIESYYPILENIKCQLDSVEDLFIKAGSDVIRRIHELKYTLLLLHSSVWPVHDVLLALNHEDVANITPATAHFLRDCQDQAKRVTDLSEFYRLLASDLMNAYLAFSDNKANQIMKVLTMVSTIFIPLSFIASVYGMNFDTSASPYNMPELKSRFGYPTVLTIMLTIATILLIAFWRAGWIGRKRARPERE